MKLSSPIFQLKRQAKLQARETGIPLYQALDRIARDEGFRSWSHLAATIAGVQAAHDILARLSPGDLVLLGARPGQGKTLLGLKLAVEAAAKGRKAFFFSLECTEEGVLRRLKSLGADRKALGNKIAIDTSDDISADYVIERVTTAPTGAVVVIDYLQLLDQRRCNPELAEQILALKNFARDAQTIVVAISQIDRSFERDAGRLPTLSDVRLPNPLDLTHFTKSCFLHDGQIRLETVA